MKILKCDACDYEVKGETFEEWMNSLKPHYGEAHADFMKMQGAKSKEEQQSGMKKWMEENRRRFEAA